MVGGHDPVKEAQWFYQYCPLRNVHANYPPTLLIHGDKDTDVPFEQSVLMDQELTAKKIKHQFIKMNNYEHGFDRAHEDKNVQKVFADVLGLSQQLPIDAFVYESYQKAICQDVHPQLC